AIMSGGTATLGNMTISNNTAPPGGGAVFNLGDMLTTGYTIFSHATPGEACVDFGLTFVSGGHNIALVDPANPLGGNCALTGTGDQTNVIDPLPAPLGNFGGPTATQALFANSPALDAGGADCPPPGCDQRGGNCMAAPTTRCCVDTDCSGNDHCTVNKFA